jgi:serine/threonine-protein kinase
VKDEPIGTVLAGYRIEALVGRGGMSAVYRAEHVHLGKTVALKILSPALAQDEDFRERFLRESRIAASIEHPNIIPIYDAGEVDGRLYIAMRYVDGLDLKQLVQQDGPLSLGRAVYIVEQVASALDAAHALGLVHRDVKPGNVLVVRGSERVFLCDFGVVKHSGSTGLTRTGYFLGTIDYAAPEQIEGRPVDARTDVYSVGCLIYECLTGKPPFARGGEMAVIHAHLTEEPPKPSTSRPDLPAAIDAVVGTAMAKRQAERYPTAGAAAHALRAVALGDVPEATDDDRPKTDETFVPAAAVVAAAPTGPPEPPSAGPPGGEAASAAPASSDGGSAPASRSRRPGWKVIAGIAALALLATAGIAMALASSGGSGGSGNTDAAMTEDTGMAASGGYPDAIEQVLLLPHIPPSIRTSCRRVAPAAVAVFLRSLKCAQAHGQPGFVTYSRAHSGDALRAYFLRRVQGTGLHYPTRLPCSRKEPAADEWARQGLLTHIEGPSHAAEGRVVCYRDGSMATIAWTDTPTKMFAEASRPAAQWNDLYAWWRQTAGPEKDLGMEMAMDLSKSHYPNAIEQELLLHHIPPSIRTSCARSTDYDHSVFVGAVSCASGMHGVSVEYMYAHNGSALKTFSDDEITAAGLNFPTSERCATAGAAADVWTLSGDIMHVERHFVREPGGLVLCYPQGSAAVIEWTDATTGIYARASAPSMQRRGLYTWWRDKAGPGALEMGAMGASSMDETSTASTSTSSTSMTSTSMG